MGTVIGRGAKKPKDDVKALRAENKKLKEENKALRAELEALKEAQEQKQPEGEQ